MNAFIILDFKAVLKHWVHSNTHFISNLLFVLYISNHVKYDTQLNNLEYQQLPTQVKSTKGIVPLLFVEQNNIFFKSRQQTLVASNTSVPHINTKLK